MKLFTWMGLSSPWKAPVTSLLTLRQVGFYPGYMVINSKGEKGCESPIYLWVTRWLLIFFGSCVSGWVVSFSCGSIWYPPFARLYCFWLIAEHWREYMLLESDMPRFRGWCTGAIDMLICDTINEDSLVMQNKSDITSSRGPRDVDPWPEVGGGRVQQGLKKFTTYALENCFWGPVATSNTLAAPLIQLDL